MESPPSNRTTRSLRGILVIFVCAEQIRPTKADDAGPGTKTYYFPSQFDIVRRKESLNSLQVTFPPVVSTICLPHELNPISLPERQIIRSLATKVIQRRNERCSGARWLSRSRRRRGRRSSLLTSHTGQGIGCARCSRDECLVVVDLWTSG